MHCSRCGQVNPQQARFCLHCGAALGIGCAACGAVLPAAARFCPQCGRPVAAGPAPASYTPRHLTEQILEGRAALQGERKQVTVLFCDIVHSTAHSQRLGAEGMHALMDRFFSHASEQVHRYEGTINQFLGDGFMALFGAPIAHEDHSRRAVLAALGLRDAVEADIALADVEIRQGINTGEIVVGVIGDDLRMDYTAFGDTVILAARLEAGAAANEILVGDSTARKVRGYFNLEVGPTVQVKERELRPLRVVGLGSRRSRLQDTDRRLAPLVGRDGDLAALAALCRGNSSGRIVGIMGEPGIGKSRLVHEFRKAIGDSAAVYEGRCLSFGSASPYLPVLDLVRDTCGIAPSDSHVDSWSKLAATLARADVAADTALPFLLQLLGDPDASARLAELDPSTIKGRTFDALTALWLGLAARASLVLVLEDLHWIDRTSEEFLAGFADELAGSPMFVVATCRPGYAPPWAGKSYATQIALSPLSAEASHQLLEATANLPQEVAQEIVIRAGGNPFFLEELAHAASETGGQPGIPGTVTEVLAARIDRLEVGARRALQCGAVLGREFTVTLLESLVDGDVGAHLQELKRSELVFERPGPERAFVFKHALTQSVAYEGLLENRRRELHAKAGRALERLAGDRLDEHYELLAYHFARSDDREKAAEYLVLANRKAAAQNAMEEAVSYFYAALAVLEELPDTRENRVRRASLLLDQTGEFHFLHRHREYYELLLRSEVLIRELDDDFLLGGYLARLGHREWTVLADFPRAAATLREAAEICERAGNEVDAGAAYAILAWTYQQIGDYPLVEVNRDLALAKLRRRFHPIWFQNTHAGSVLAYTCAGQWRHALREAETAITEGRSRADAGIVSFNAAFASFAALEQRDWNRAVEYAQLALREAPTVYFEGLAQMFLASCLCSTGQLDQGLPVLEAIVPMAEASEHRVIWMFSASFLADAYGSSARVDDARELAERVLNWAERGSAGYLTARAHRTLGALEAASGRPAAAVAHLDRAIEVAERTGSENELALAFGERGRLLRGVGGRADLERALAILNRLGTRVEPERIRAELAVAAT